MHMYKTLAAALLGSTLAVATPALAQLGVGGALNGSTTIQPQAGTPPINGGASGNISGSIQTPSTAPATNRIDNATDRAAGAVNNAADRAQNRLESLPNANASASGSANAQAGVAGENIGGGANASASADSDSAMKSATSTMKQTRQRVTRASVAAERRTTQELNNASANGTLNAGSSASVNVPPAVRP